LAVAQVAVALFFFIPAAQVMVHLSWAVQQLAFASAPTTVLAFEGS
jgi:TRAP-type mannitol/chloroaromatic compound transport system permease small subunit